MDTNLKDFIPVIGTLLGAIIGAYTAALAPYINYRMNQKTERRNRKLKKLEEAYVTLYLLDILY